MKFIIAALSSVLLLAACSSDKVEQVGAETEQVAANEFTDAQRQEITDYFLSEEEPTVLDATWTDDKIFKIGVKDDGSRRDGFAQYACEEINNQFDAKEQSVWVQIVDYDKLMKTKEWVKLGEAHC
jgi:protein involved in sex pheromone biosynthesis